MASSSTAIFSMDVGVARAAGGWRLARDLGGAFSSPLACLLTDLEAVCMSMVERGVDPRDVLGLEGEAVDAVGQLLERLDRGLRGFRLGGETARGALAFPEPPEILSTMSGPPAVGLLHREFLPTDIVWYVSTRCPRRCHYCHYVKKGSSEFEEDAISREAILALVDQAALSGVERFSMTGGEPFLRPDLLDIVRHARARGLDPWLFTRAMIGDPLAERIAAAGVGTVFYSLDTTSRTHASRIVDDAGVVEEALASIRALHAANVRVVVVPVITAVTAGDLVALARAVKRAGASAIRPLAYGGHVQNPYNDLLTPTQEQLDQIRTDLSMLTSEIMVDDSILRTEVTRTCCESGLNTLYVMPDGRVAYCPYTNQHRGSAIGDVRKDNIWDLWYSSRLAGQMAANKLRLAEPRAAQHGGDESACILRKVRLDVL